MSEGGGGGDGERADAIDGATILEVFCRAQVAALPHGRRGVRAAMGLLTALPAASRLGWADMTVSAPQLFRMLEDEGLIAGCPNTSDMPSALRLVASVCRLVTQRSPRRWTVWFSRASDPDDALGASIREAVTPAMLRRPLNLTLSGSPSRTASIRDERDQLAAELDSLKEKFNALQSEHDAVQMELTSAREKAVVAARELADGKRERGQLADSLETVRGKHESLRRKLKEVSRRASEAESSRDDFDGKCRSLVKKRGALEKQLTDLQSQAQRRIAKVEHEREQERRQAARLETAKTDLERDRTNLRVELADLSRTRDVQAQQIIALRDDIHRANKSRSILRKTLEDIEENLEIAAFDPERPLAFVVAVVEAVIHAENQTSHVAAVCARTLDKNTIKLFRAAGTLHILRNNEFSEAAVDKFFEDYSSKIFAEYVQALETIRSKLALEGVVLPATEVTRDDLLSG